MNNSLRIGSHNSFSYARPKEWWMRPFYFVGRCQKWNIAKQYESGVRLFDLRIKKGEYGIVEIAHGSMVFGISESELNYILRYLDSQCDCFVRVVLEYNNTPDDTIAKIAWFQSVIEQWQETYKHILFFGGRCKWNWEQVALKDVAEPSLDDKYSSTQPPVKWDDWCPWLYARLYNRENISNGTDKDFLFIDFVNIR